MTEQEVRALCLLARLQITSLHKIWNGYSAGRDDPWWLVNIDGLGLVEIGWRKRVISIDWSSTQVRGEVTTDDVTKGDSNVHAWSVGRAIDYLIALRRLAERKRYLDEHPEDAAGKNAPPVSDSIPEQNKEQPT